MIIGSRRAKLAHKKIFKKVLAVFFLFLAIKTQDPDSQCWILIHVQWIWAWIHNTAGGMGEKDCNKA
jgi:hypothetical protein